MNRKEVLSTINNLESEFPTTTWTIHGVHIWPYIRIQLLFFLYNSETNKSVNQALSVNEDVSLSRKFLLMIKGVLFIARIMFTSRKIKHLFFSYFSYSINSNGNQIDKFCESIRNTFPSSSRVLQLRLGQKVAPVRRSGYLNIEPVFYLFELIEFKLLRRISGQQPEENLSRYNDFLQTTEKLTSIQFADFISKEKITNQALSIQLKAKLFKWIISRFKSEVVYQICYYNHLSINLAARNIGVPVVDIQHGIMGKINAHYMRWEQQPENGFNTLPTHFWCWDQEDVDHINDSHPGNPAFKGGNPWYQFFMKNQIEEITFDKTKKNILYTMQNRTEILPDSLAESINKLPNTNWLIRMHPSHISKKEQIIEAFAKKVKNDNIDFETANNRSLFTLLKHTDLHITGYSATIVEASMLGVKTLTLHPDAQHYFGGTSYEHLITYADSDSDIKMLIETTLEKSSEYEYSSELIDEVELLKFIKAS